MATDYRWYQHPRPSPKPGFLILEKGQQAAHALGMPGLSMYRMVAPGANTPGNAAGHPFALVSVAGLGVRGWLQRWLISRHFSYAPWHDSDSPSEMSMWRVQAHIDFADAEREGALL